MTSAKDLGYRGDQDETATAGSRWEGNFAGGTAVLAADSISVPAGGTERPLDIIERELVRDYGAVGLNTVREMRQRGSR